MIFIKYMGSKARLSKDLAPIINSIIKEKEINTYIEPFVGGANMIDKVACRNKIGYDKHKYLIALLNAIKNGYKPPYQNTSQKGYADKDQFDYEYYWNWVRRISKNNIVLCSEYNAPDDFIKIYEKVVSTNLAVQSRKKDTEKLFIHKTRYIDIKDIIKNQEWAV